MCVIFKPMWPSNYPTTENTMTDIDTRVVELSNVLIGIENITRRLISTYFEPTSTMSWSDLCETVIEVTNAHIDKHNPDHTALVELELTGNGGVNSKTTISKNDGSYLYIGVTDISKDTIQKTCV